jgi:hypothetical protein
LTSRGATITDDESDDAVRKELQTYPTKATIRSLTIRSATGARVADGIGPATSGRQLRATNAVAVAGWIAITALAAASAPGNGPA